MRKKLIYNSASSIIYQLTAVVCGFVLSHLILESFGSEINGLTNSIAQFLQIIAFLDLGVGTVVRTTLYKPLVENNTIEISRILVSAGRFFRRIAYILVAYIGVLLFIFPIVIDKRFDFFFTCTLILSMSISSFAQYYFGIVNQLLLTADQKGYVQYHLQTVTVILNTAACAILINMGVSIQIVKLTTSLIFLTRPVYLRWYVNQNYTLDRKVTFVEEPIKQKWNGFAQHLAAVILDNTDTIVLTLFATLSDVSIYSVYFLVIHGVKQLFQILTSSIQAMLGERYAKGEEKELKISFFWVEWFIHTSTTFVFGCTLLLIVPFVSVYTRNITDANYMVPVFAGVLTLAHAMHCLRLPYHSMILAAGHFKQTQANYLIAMFMNIIISVITVRFWGLVGVAIGTLFAMLYQTVWMAFYNYKEILHTSIWKFMQQLLVDSLTVIIAVTLTKSFFMNETNYLAWVFLAVKVSIIWLLTALGINCIFYKEKMMELGNWKRLIRRK